ncbi:MAG TPA: hypothetical protein EYH42_00180 [Sulfurovum sp.]|nr:hypothetical protein [Sulfurovum sp.]
MKFLISKDLGYNKLLSFLMIAVVMSILMYLVLDAVLHGYVIGFDLHSIDSTLYGNTETFEEPVLIDSLLMQVHIDLFMTIFSLLTLASIYIRLYKKEKANRWLLHVLFGTGIAAPTFLLAAYFFSKPFMYAWLVTFLLWHLLAVMLSVIILKKLYTK